MDDFWKVALGLTGIAGVGSFVFYRLYKQSIQLRAFESLTREQRYRLFVLFLVLTFIFAFATLGIYASEAHLKHSHNEMSREELERDLKVKHSNGERKLSELEADKTIPVDQRATIRQIHAEYSQQTKNTEDALQQGDATRYHESIKQTVSLLTSDKAKKALPAADQSFMQHDACEHIESESESASLTAHLEGRMTVLSMPLVQIARAREFLDLRFESEPQACSLRPHA